MREVNNWDLLRWGHFVTIFVFIGLFYLESKAVRLAVIQRKRVLSAVLVLLVILTLGLGFFVRQIAFPGGGLYDTKYMADWAYVVIIQERLNGCKVDAGKFPTTAQFRNNDDLNGLGAHCAELGLSLRWAKNLIYKSDGNTYELEISLEDYFPGLVAWGSSEKRAAFYKRQR